MELTSRQRLFRLFRGEEIDRIPIWLLAPYHHLDYYADIYDIPCYAPVVKEIETYCDTFDRRRPDVGFCYNANKEILITPIREKDRNGSQIRYHGQCLEKYVSRQDGYTQVKSYVTEPDQLLEILNVPYVTPAPDLEQFRKEKDELGERGLFMMDLGDPLEPLYHLCSAGDFSVWTLTDYDAILEFADEMYNRVYKLYRYFLENDVGDVFFIVGAEFAGPPLVSPSHFNEMCVRYVKGIVDLIRSYGKYSIVHYHGNLSQVLSGFRNIKPDGLHTIEAPPVGDCTISQAREALGKDMILIGNIQYDDIVRKTPQEIESMVQDAIREGKGGRFILSPTAGPYEKTIDEKTVANYVAFIRAGIKYGRL